MKIANLPCFVVLCLTVTLYAQSAEIVYQQAYLKASNTGAADEFGTSVSVFEDTVVVGARSESSDSQGVNGDQDNDNASLAGAAYVYTCEAGDWVQEAYLKASNTEKVDQFGISVSVSGNRIVVGAHTESSLAVGVNGNELNNDGPNSGAAYVFVKVNGEWQQEAYLKASNTQESDLFGWSVAISGDTIVVGAPGEDSSSVGVNGDQFNNSSSGSGAAYVFVRNPQSGWGQEAYLKPSNTESQALFGEAVAIDGDRIAVAALREDVCLDEGEDEGAASVVDGAGAVYVYERDAMNWAEEARFVSPIPLRFAEFGKSLSIYDRTLVVGAPSDDLLIESDNPEEEELIDRAGAAYVYSLVEGSLGFQCRLIASNPDAVDNFGNSVSIYGEKLAVGANREKSSSQGVDADQSNNLGNNVGAAYLFQKVGTCWSQTHYIKASNASVYDHRFGNSIAISQGRLLVGSWTEDSDSTGVNGDETNRDSPTAGAAYLFSLASNPFFVAPSLSLFSDGNGTVKIEWVGQAGVDDWEVWGGENLGQIETNLTNAALITEISNGVYSAELGVGVENEYFYQIRLPLAK